MPWYTKQFEFIFDTTEKTIWYRKFESYRNRFVEFDPYRFEKFEFYRNFFEFVRYRYETGKIPVNTGIV